MPASLKFKNLVREYKNWHLTSLYKWGNFENNRPKRSDWMMFRRKSLYSFFKRKNSNHLCCSLISMTFVTQRSHSHSSVHSNTTTDTVTRPFDMSKIGAWSVSADWIFFLACYVAQFLPKLLCIVLLVCWCCASCEGGGHREVAAPHSEDAWQSRTKGWQSRQERKRHD